MINVCCFQLLSMGAFAAGATGNGNRDSAKDP